MTDAPIDQDQRESTPVPKKIVLFSDGTGNSSANPQKTNVWRAYKALDTSHGSHQIAYYDNGVGTSPFTPTALLGLAFGFGLARNVRQIYGFLCRTYQPGDEIYAFGFSRGAFTIRVAVALIASQGIIRPDAARDERDLKRLIAYAYRRFRKDSFTPSFLSSFMAPLRDKLLGLRDRLFGLKGYDPSKNTGFRANHTADKFIKFIGVWDTVDAYGLPIDELTVGWDKVVWPLSAKDRDLSIRVSRACQALALDEQRESFEPMLWNEKNEGNEKAERLTQVWFPGVHSNVGGGYPDDALALVALNWILHESENDGGLAYIPTERQRYQSLACTAGEIHDSRSGIGNLYRYEPRNLERLCRQKRPGLANTLRKKVLRRKDASENEVFIKTPKIHYSVFHRIACGGDAYAPINIPRHYAVASQEEPEPPGKVAPAMSPAVFEDVSQADTRRTRQALVGNLVWLRRQVYTVTLISLIGFIVFPFIAKPTWSDTSSGYAKVFDPILGTFSEIVRMIPELVGKIPGLGFAGDWASQYAQFPYPFSLGLLGIILLLIWSARLRLAVQNEMRLNWHQVSESTREPPGVHGRFRTVFAQWLESDFYHYRVKGVIRIALESVGVILFFLLSLGVFSHLVFKIQDGFGVVCPDPESATAHVLGQPFRFDPADTCFDTGLDLSPEKTYELRFEVHEWKDASINANATGWQDAPWRMYLASPFLRHYLAGWYQPIARVGDKLFDVYPLGDDLAASSSSGDTLRMRFTPHREGRLYLYINDAVLFNPALIPLFYSNNAGHACVLIQPVPDKNARLREPESEPPPLQC